MKSSCVVLLALLLSVNSVHSADPTHGQINDPDGYTNVRSGPSVNEEVVAKVQENEVFQILEYGESWSVIKTPGGKVGYMHTSRISPIAMGGVESQATNQETLYTRIIRQAKTSSRFEDDLWSARAEIANLPKSDRDSLAVAIKNTGVMLDGERAETFADIFGWEFLERRTGSSITAPQTVSVPIPQQPAPGISIGDGVSNPGFLHFWNGKVIDVKQNGAIVVRLTYVADSGINPSNWRSGSEVTLTPGEYRLGARGSLGAAGGGR